MFVWFDGSVMPEKEALININSEAFRYGQGFFTTTRIEKGVPLWIEEHIERLEESLERFSLPLFVPEPVLKAAMVWPFMNGVNEGLLRIIAFKEEKKTKVYISGQSLRLEETAPVKIGLASFSRHSSQPLLQVKNLNYWENILAHEEASKKGWYDALFLNERKEVCETSRCNIFWAEKETLYTPHPDCGLLPGIARKKVLGIAERLGIAVKTGFFETEHLREADEVFLTNSLRGIVSVKWLEEKEYKGTGGMTCLLADEFKKEIDGYIEKASK
ncbi:aminotransferase class IV [Thermosyntropha sp.]|uniref:aminotransferase class IV n=1 Tax=Thermosyntropha sp. TaxID=2740820 RepID=UPI0025DBA23B|nr:aminotransferase class IV [Thermosyntropha sp.]MBO8159788.1 aminotransferase class IV [Thermosyntropha sp.]